MNTPSESDKQFRTIGQEPLQWLEKAQGQRYCAEVLKNHLLENLALPRARRRVETLGLVNSTLFLLGQAFENLIKGVMVAKDPGLVDFDLFDIKNLKKVDGGHGISSLACALVSLESDEEELLDRLQESIYWAGRFPIPLTSKRYYESNHPVNKHQFNVIDFEVSDRLFNKLERELRKFRVEPNW
jgi:hypothetical protein